MYNLSCLTPAQRWLTHYFKLPYAWFDCISFNLKQEVSLRRVKEAISALVKRHDGLRTAIIQEGGRWQQKIHSELDEDLLEPLMIDGEHLSEHEYAIMLQELQLNTCCAFKIDQLPLFKTVVIKRAPDNYAFCILFHHIIVDYVSLVLFFKEFYQGYQNGHLKDIPKNTNRMYACEIENLEASAALCSYQKLSATHPTGLFKDAFPTTEAKGIHLKGTLDKENSLKLIHESKRHFNIHTLHPIVAAPLYKIMTELTQHSAVQVSHKLHGREIYPHDRRYFSVIGNFAVNVPILCHIHPDDSWMSIVHKIDSSMAESAKSNLMYDIRGPQLPAGSYPDHHMAPIRLNFMGNVSFALPECIEIDFHRHKINL
jgi:fengycin family lipopeptide synthetase B